MARPPVIIAALCSAALFAWAVHLALDPAPFTAGPAAVLAVSLATTAVVLGAALLLSRTRWARQATAVAAISGLGLGVVTPLDPLAVTGIALSGVALAAALGPWLTASLRRLPAAEAPPASAVRALVAPAIVPAVVALARYDWLGPFDWVLIGVAIAAALGLLRAQETGLWIARLGLPVAAVLAGIADGFPTGLIVAAAGVSAAIPAWNGDVIRSVQPILPSVGNVAMPPELVDPGLLDAAGFDDRGRSKEATS